MKKDLHMMFIVFEKVYDRVLREVIWWAWEEGYLRYMNFIKDIMMGWLHIRIPD